MITEPEQTPAVPAPRAARRFSLGADSQKRKEWYSKRPTRRYPSDNGKIKKVKAMTALPFAALLEKESERLQARYEGQESLRAGSYKAIGNRGAAP